MKITSDRNDPEYRPWNDPTVRGLSEADFPDEQQIIIDALVAALETVQSDGKKYRNVMSGTTLAAVDAALALARGEG